MKRREREMADSHNGLGLLLHLVSVRPFGVMYGHTFLNLQVTRSDIRPHIKWVVSLVIAYA